MAELVGIDRLAVKVIGTKRNRFPRVLMIFISGDHNKFGFGRKFQNFLDGGKPIRRSIRIRWHPEINLNHRGRLRTELSDSPFAIAGDRYIVIVKALPQLTLNNGVVIDDQEFALFFSHTVAESSPATPPVTATAGNLIVTTVPTPSLLCTSIRPPFSRTYSRLSNAPMPYLLPFEALNGLNNSSRMNAGDIPEPLSDTSITASGPLVPRRISTNPSSPMESRALSMTCAIAEPSSSSSVTITMPFSSRSNFSRAPEYKQPRFRRRPWTLRRSGF